MEDLQKLIVKTRAKYERIGRVHLLYKGNRKKRPTQEQRYKLKLFPLVIPTIKIANEIKSIRTDPRKKNVRYYAIIAKVGKNRACVRVIIKQVASGQFNYHSVMLDNK